MSDIYLTRLEVEGFRVFRRRFDLALEPKGVNIIVGQNGLGKSSVFEAIEWGLCGRVRRLEALPSEERAKPELNDYYANRGPDDQPTPAFYVRLHFDTWSGRRETAVIHRGRRRTRQWNNVSPELTPKDVLAILRSPEWQLEIGDPAEYLWQTHFFAQSSQLRPAAQDKKTRWENFAGPAAFQRLDEAQERLGRSVTNAFTRLRTSAEATRDELSAKHREFAERLGRYREGLPAQSADGEIDPAAAKAARRELGVALRVLIQEINGSESISEPELTAPSILIQKAERMLANRHHLLGAVRGIPERLVSLQTDLEDQRRRQEVSEEQKQAVMKTVAAAVEERGRANAALEAATEAVVIRRRDLESLQQARKTVLGLEKSRGSLPDTERSLAERTVRVTDANERAHASAQAVDASLRASSDAEAARRASAAIEDLSTRLREAQGRRVEANARLQRLAETDDHARRIQAAHLQLATEMEAHRAQLGNVESKVRALQEVNDALLHSVAEIASILADDADECPVCGTTDFHGQTLRQRVLDRVGRSAPALAESQRNADSIRERIAALTREDRMLQEQLATLAAERAAIVQQSAEAESAWKWLFRDELLRGVSEEGAFPYLDAEKQRLASVVSTGIDASTLSRLREESRRAARAAEVEAEELNKESEAVERLKLEILAGEQAFRDQSKTIARLRRRDTSAEAVIAAATRAIELAEQTVRETSSTFDDARQRAESAAESLVSVDATLSRVQSEQIRTKEQIAGIMAQWNATGLGGTPSASLVDDMVAECGGWDRRLAASKRQRDIIDENAARWTRSQELNEGRRWLDAQLTDEERAKDPPPYDRHLEKLYAKLTAVQQEIEKTNSAQALVREVAAALRDRKSDFVENVVAPFNILNNKFYLALSTFPGRRIVLDPNTTNSGTILPLKVLLHADTLVEDKAVPVYAPHILSEGQLASWSLGMVCAMSTAYRWSRWPALLLDDPLQQCDVVHAAAVADLLANLVAERGYQIILSTHDLSLADFIRRKLRARHVPCRAFPFLHPGSMPIIEDTESDPNPSRRE